jgi:hypothetical protein
MEQSEPNMAEQQISLIDGGMLVAVEDEWPALATSSYGTLHGGAYLIVRLAVRRHQDGRTLMHLEERVGGKSKHAGALFADATFSQVREAARLLIAERELPSSLAEECLAELGQKGLA